jgi:hypothetical protein
MRARTALIAGAAMLALAGCGSSGGSSSSGGGSPAPVQSSSSSPAPVQTLNQPTSVRQVAAELHLTRLSPVRMRVGPRWRCYRLRRCLPGE